MNFDRFTRDRTPIAGMVKPATVPAEGAPPAAGAEAAPAAADTSTNN
jgi:hypothetical protein